MPHAGQDGAPPAGGTGAKRDAYPRQPAAGRPAVRKEAEAEESVAALRQASAPAISGALHAAPPVRAHAGKA